MTLPDLKQNVTRAISIEVEHREHWSTPPSTTTSHTGKIGLDGCAIVSEPWNESSNFLGLDLALALKGTAVDIVWIRSLQMYDDLSLGYGGPETKRSTTSGTIGWEFAIAWKEGSSCVITFELQILVKLLSVLDSDVEKEETSSVVDSARRLILFFSSSSWLFSLALLKIEVGGLSPQGVSQVGVFIGTESIFLLTLGMNDASAFSFNCSPNGSITAEFNSSGLDRLWKGTGLVDRLMGINFQGMPSARRHWWIKGAFPQGFAKEEQIIVVDEHSRGSRRSICIWVSNGMLTVSIWNSEDTFLGSDWITSQCRFWTSSLELFLSYSVIISSFWSKMDSSSSLPGKYRLHNEIWENIFARFCS